MQSCHVYVLIKNEHVWQLVWNVHTWISNIVCCTETELSSRPIVEEYVWLTEIMTDNARGLDSKHCQVHTSEIDQPTATDFPGASKFCQLKNYCCHFKYCYLDTCIQNAKSLQSVH